MRNLRIFFDGIFNKTESSVVYIDANKKKIGVNIIVMAIVLSLLLLILFIPLYSVVSFFYLFIIALTIPITMYIGFLRLFILNETIVEDLYIKRRIEETKCSIRRNILYVQSVMYDSGYSEFEVNEKAFYLNMRLDDCNNVFDLIRFNDDLLMIIKKLSTTTKKSNKNTIVDVKEALKNNYLNVLGLDSLPKDLPSLKKHFRRLAKEWHPDVSEFDTHDEFVEINNAFNYLKDLY